MKNVNQDLNTLTEQLTRQLEAEAFPNVCKLRDENYEALERMIISLAVSQEMTIQEAIAQTETDLLNQ